jgi:hypothetical protein
MCLSNLKQLGNGFVMSVIFMGGSGGEASRS